MRLLIDFYSLVVKLLVIDALRVQSHKKCSLANK